MRPAWFEGLKTRLECHFDAGPARDGAHNLAHALRVARNAEALALEAGAEVETCLAAALLHDLVYLPKNHPDSSRTAALGAEAARAWCAAEPALAGRAEAICEAIRTHSFSSGAQPTSLEGAILQDADRFEALGAIGLARCFATGGAMGAGLWHEADPWAQGRELDDKRWSLDHFACKLLKLADTMKTPAARREAQVRHAVLEAFLTALKRELDQQGGETGPAAAGV